MDGKEERGSQLRKRWGRVAAGERRGGGGGGVGGGGMAGEGEMDVFMNTNLLGEL